MPQNHYLAFIIVPFLQGSLLKESWAQLYNAGNMFFDLFGGYSSTLVSGGWTAPNGDRIKDNSHLVFAIYQYGAGKLGNLESDLTVLAEAIKDALGQESVMVGWDIPIQGIIKFL